MHRSPGIWSKNTLPLKPLPNGSAHLLDGWTPSRSQTARKPSSRSSSSRNLTRTHTPLYVYQRYTKPGGNTAEITSCVFLAAGLLRDLLAVDGEVLRDWPLIERKRTLRTFIIRAGRRNGSQPTVPSIRIAAGSDRARSFGGAAVRVPGDAQADRRHADPRWRGGWRGGSRRARRD
jgi:hypothetical protein